MIDVIQAPEALEISDAIANEKLIAAWWRRVQLYVEIMNDLGRTVVINYGGDLFFLSSFSEIDESTDV